MFPSLMFNRFPSTFQPRSIFEEMEGMFDDTWMDMDKELMPTHGMLAIAPTRQRHHAESSRHHSKPWAATVDLRGYRPEEVAIKRESVENDKSQHRIVVHAKHEAGEDFAELKKTVLIPKEVDHEKVSTHITKESVLVIKGPFIKKDGGDNQIVHRRHDFPAVWDELHSLRNDMARPFYGGIGAGVLQPQIIKCEDGSQKWQAKFNVAGLKPGDYSMRNEGNRVILEGKRESKSEHHHSTANVYESVTVPAGVKVDDLRSQLINNDTVLLEGPYVTAEKLEGAKKIPIKNSSETTEADNKMTVN